MKTWHCVHDDETYSHIVMFVASRPMPYIIHNLFIVHTCVQFDLAIPYCKKSGFRISEKHLEN